MTRELSPKAVELLIRLLQSDRPMSLEELMEGITESEGSFRVFLCSLRAAGYDIEPVTMFRMPHQPLFNSPSNL